MRYTTCPECHDTGEYLEQITIDGKIIAMLVICECQE